MQNRIISVPWTYKKSRHQCIKTKEVTFLKNILRYHHRVLRYHRGMVRCIRVHIPHYKHSRNSLEGFHLLLVTRCKQNKFRWCALKNSTFLYKYILCLEKFILRSNWSIDRCMCVHGSSAIWYLGIVKYPMFRFKYQMV